MQNVLNIAFWPTLMSGGVAFLVAMLLVLTQHWHGHLSMDNTFGVQKVHIHPTPRVGGIAIAAGVLIGYALASPSIQILLGPLLLAGSPAFVFGLVEDITKQVSIRTRLLATMGCGVLGWAITGYSITHANVPGLDWLLGFTIFSVLFTAFAVGGIANAINIIDGFNGLSAGTVIIILIALALMTAGLGDRDLATVCLILAGVVIGFLVVNWPFGKIFMGDGGAYFLGFALAWIAVLMSQRHPDVSAWAPMLVCGFPILEVLFSIMRRHRRKLSPGHPDRLHLHSLVRRRLICAWLPQASNLMQNSATGALMWFAALMPAVIAVVWFMHTTTLVLGFLICCLLYAIVYARLTNFCWFWNIRTSPLDKAQPNIRSKHQ